MSLGFERESRMVGHFPPSSRVTGVKCFAAADMTMRPTRGLPERDTYIVKVLFGNKSFLVLVFEWSI